MFVSRMILRFRNAHEAMQPNDLSHRFESVQNLRLFCCQNWKRSTTAVSLHSRKIRVSAPPPKSTTACIVFLLQCVDPGLWRRPRGRRRPASHDPVQHPAWSVPVVGRGRTTPNQPEAALSHRRDLDGGHSPDPQYHPVRNVTTPGGRLIL